MAGLLALIIAGGFAGSGALYAWTGLYGFQVLLRRGGSIWTAVAPDDPRLSPAMRLALGAAVPEPRAGSVAWQTLAEGFEVAELPVIADDREVDRIFLTRLDPKLYRLEVRNLPSGGNLVQDWLTNTGAVFAINGSYYGKDGTPDTPLVSGGQPLGPGSYDARHGAVVVSGSRAEIRDLQGEDWRAALAGAEAAMVSYPLLLSKDGSHRVQADKRWLANRSFVAQDGEGRIVLGTTADAFFSLDRLAAFLKNAPLDLDVALNLDGGPVACQAVRLAEYRRDVCGRCETSVRDGKLSLLTWPWGERWGLPIVLTAARR